MLRGPLTVLLARLGVVVVLYALLRILFVLLNHDAFPNVPAMAFIGGLRFDVSAIGWLNMMWAVLYMVKPDARGWFALTQKLVFHLVNTVGFFFNSVDLAYYHFTLKRSTADLFGIMSAGGDVGNLAPVFVRDYWYVVVIFLASIALAEVGYRWAARFMAEDGPKLWRRFAWRAVAIALLVLASRGGLQLMPLAVLDASSYAPPAYFPVVLNTPFTMMMSLGKPVIEEKKFMSEKEAFRIWPVVHNYKRGALTMNQLYWLEGVDTINYPAPQEQRGLRIPVDNKPNVVFIILESFSAAYSAKLSGGEGYMPFLDSLMGQSLNFTKAYANGRRSIDGIPAITASIPELMDEAFITSNYAQTPFTSIASVLAADGYATSFYHGGRNGTMGFDGFAKSAGFQRYVGKNEYPEPKDDDGSWGIWDVPFLQFFARDLSKEKQPFMSCVFTLSSHHPYELKPEDAARFKGGPLPIHRTLQYTDDALRQFFATARTQPWYANTLFVITADHTADIDRNGQHYSEATDYWVPLLYFMPSAIVPQPMVRITQHIDIMPTALDLIGYEKPFFSFGSSALRDERRACMVTATTGAFLAIDSATIIRRTAAELENGVLHSTPIPIGAEHELKAAIQQFNNHMLRRDLIVK
ncbi:MAG: sulfatase-like hydrolase/transferase [Flavobacteriales bacterium]